MTHPLDPPNRFDAALCRCLLLVGAWASPAIAEPIIYLDAEEASLDAKQWITDNGGTYPCTLEGCGKNLRIEAMTDQAARAAASVESNRCWISDTQARRGGHSLAYEAVPRDGEWYKQRVEHRVAGTKEESNRRKWELREGQEHYTGFSILLDKDRWTPPGKADWFNIHQIKQEGYEVYSNILLSFAQDGTNTLVLNYRHGRNGANGNHVMETASLLELTPGQWYDVVVGWKFSPHRPEGFCFVWIKPATATDYQRFGFDRTPFGYSQGQLEILSCSLGIYRKVSDKINRIYFDEIRVASRFEDARIPQ